MKRETDGDGPPEPLGRSLKRIVGRLLLEWGGAAFLLVLTICLAVGDGYALAVVAAVPPLAGLILYRRAGPEKS